MIRWNSSKWHLFLALVTFFSIHAWAENGSPSPDGRMNWFREARFGLFIHWGIYSIPAGEWNGVKRYGEWFQEETRMPNSQYEKFATQFNPTNFDARQWVKTAKQAGMKYLVITAKHHDGFCLFDSACTDYTTVKATPWKRDPLKELSEACNEEGIKLGFFYSIADWHHPEMPKQYNQFGFRGAPNIQADVRKYGEYGCHQISELLTNYGPVATIWFDGNCGFDVSEATKWVSMIHKLQPDCLINDRLGISSDYGTPEQSIPYGIASRDFEVCMTLNDHWGYNRADQNWKSAQTVIRDLATTASRGGNFLLNIGPTAQGEFPPSSLAILKQVGNWLADNGESIYGTGGTPLRNLGWGVATQKATHEGTTVYLHVFEWPTNGLLTIPRLRNSATVAYLLTDPAQKTLKCRPKDSGLTISIPSAPSNTNSSTIVLKLSGPIQLVTQEIAQDADGKVRLPASDAIYHGSGVQYEERADRQCVGYWLDPADWIEWEFQLKKPGEFQVSGALASIGRGGFKVTVGDQVLSGTAPKTGDYGVFATINLGKITVTSPGKVTVSVRPQHEGWQPLNLKYLEFKPIEENQSAVVK